MKKRVLVLLLLAPMLLLAQVKGEKSEETFVTPKGTTFNVGDIVTLGKASNGGKFAYAYISKSGFSLGKITSAVKSVNDARNMDVNNVKNISNTLNKVNDLANSELVSSLQAQLMGQAVSSDYVLENALDASMGDKKFKIKKFKIYTDKDTGEKIVHAIAKGNGKTVAILLEFAEKTGEI